MDIEEDDGGSSLMFEYLPSEVLFEIYKLLSWQDIIHMAQTCRRFYELCKMNTVWLQLKSLDFRRCSIPISSKIINVLKKCPNIVKLRLGNVITSDDTRMRDDDVETTATDRFLLQVLRCCSNLKRLDLSMHELTDSSVDAICAKCENLRSLKLTDNEFISNEGIINLLSYLPFLTQLHIINCSNLIPMIRHKDEGHLLSLTDVRIQTCELYKANVLTLLRSCLQLQHLSLIDTVLQGFPNIELTEKTGLNTLKTLELDYQFDIREVNLGQCDNLEILQIRRCPHLLLVNMLAPKLHTFEIKECMDLKSINFLNVQLSSVDLSSCGNLAVIGIDSHVLKSLDISDCNRLSLDQFLIGLPNKRCLTHLNITGCSKIGSSDINKILSEFSNLEHLIFGGEHLTAAEINSVDLTNLCFKKNKVISCLPLNVATLKTLMFDTCTGLTEQQLMDGLLFGEKRNHGVEGLETLIRDTTDYTPFKGRVGVPGLEYLTFHHVPGIQGHMLSESLGYFKHLKEVQIKHCVCLKELHIYNIPVLSTLTVESCNHLSTVRVHSMHKLQTIVIKWCSMINSFSVEDVKLQQLDVTGCNFAHFVLRSSTLSVLSLSGVCTQPSHSLKLKCPKLTELSIQKCNALEDVVLHGLFAENPSITSLNLSVSDLIRCISVPSDVTSFSVTALKRLQAINMEQPVKIQHLKLNNLIKFTPSSRIEILKACSKTLTKLEVRAIPKETDLSLDLPNLEFLTLDQGIDLLKLEIFCPKLLYLRIQGCPRLSHMLLQLNKLSQLQVNHSSPLLALRTMILHVTHVQHVAHILAHYSPYLTELELNGSKVTKEYLQELGLVIHKLSRINLVHCDLDENLKRSGDSFVIVGSDFGKGLKVNVNIYNEMDTG